MRRILQKASGKVILKSLYSEKRYLKNGREKLLKKYQKQKNIMVDYIFKA